MIWLDAMERSRGVHLQHRVRDAHKQSIKGESKPSLEMVEGDAVRRHKVLSTSGSRPRDAI